MKKYLSLFVVLIIALSVNIQGARAEDSNTEGGSETNVSAKQISIEANIRAQAQVKIDALRASIKLEKDALKARIEEARINIRENALKRFDGAVEKLSNLKARVDTQITKLEAKGVNVTVAKSQSALVEEKLNETNTKIAQIHAMLSVSISELTPDKRAALRTLAKDIETLLKDAHMALNVAIKSLKGGIRIKMDAEANVKVNTDGDKEGSGKETN